MIIVVGDSVSDIVTSDDWEDGEDEHDEEAEQRQLSEDDQPGWVMGIITKTLPRAMDRVRKMQIKLDDLTQLGWEDSADYICQEDTKYGTSCLRVPEVVQPPTDDEVAAPAATPFGVLMECLDIVCALSQLPQGISREGCNDMRPGSQKPQSNMTILDLASAAERDS